MLIAAVGFGAVLVSFAMAFNIMNGLRQKDIKKSLFSSNGLAGFIFYWAVIFAVLPALGFGHSPLTFPYVTAFVALPLTLIFLREPLGDFISGKRNAKAHGAGIGAYIVENLFELMEVLLSYVTNTISFLRIGAFALSHAGMMLVVYQLAQRPGRSDSLAVVVIGNILVICVEGLLVGIQALRLEFYEIFGRFYSGGGERYNPSAISYRRGE